jgi:VanZ family protein
VVAWAALISLFSTGLFAGDITGQLLIPILAVLFPGATPAELHALHAMIRKLSHFLEYLVLSVLLYRALRSPMRSRLETAGAAVVIAGLYAIADEFHQYFVPGRTAAVTDCLIDVSGAAAGQGLIAALGRGSRAG